MMLPPALTHGPSPQVKGGMALKISGIVMRSQLKLTSSDPSLRNLISPAKEGKSRSVATRLTMTNTTKIGPGTIAAALAALSMAVIAHFFI
jgi:hypothetical protein